LLERRPEHADNEPLEALLVALTIAEREEHGVARSSRSERHGPWPRSPLRRSDGCSSPGSSRHGAPAAASASATSALPGVAHGPSAAASAHDMRMLSFFDVERRLGRSWGRRPFGDAERGC
jgi:hypothetical protein